MRRISYTLVSVLLAASLSGCQLVAALLPGGSGDMGLLPNDGTCASYQVVPADGGPVSRDMIEQTRTIIENRVNATGVAEPIVHADDEGLLWVGLPVFPPESEFAQEIRSLIGTTGVLEFMPVPLELQRLVGEGPLPEGMLDVEPLFTGLEIDSAAVGQDQTTGEIVVNLQLKETGARLFDEYAEDHYGEQFAIVLDNEVMSAPAIQATRFGGRAQISGGQGGFAPSEAQSLVTVLKFGSLPLEIREVGYGTCP
jgi:protein-export membrane protein SecD